MAKDDLNMTKLELRFLSVFLNNRHKKFYATEIAKILGISYGSVVPLLMRFEKAKWLEIDWEDIDPKTEGRPKRKYFGLSELGMTKAKQAIRSEIEFLEGTRVGVFQ
jgi:PadR family transcriptional regulator, regulatory protein PadR